jgi:uncharacterized membrane protein HdeD (DUF308 family)
MPLYSPTSRFAKPIAVLLIVLGMLSIIAPLISSVVITFLLACLILAAGVMHLVLAFHHQSLGSRFWHLLAALVLIVGGGVLLSFPLDALTTFTLVIAWMFVVSGIMRIAAWFSVRGKTGAGWMLADGVITALLGGALIAQWPGSSFWTIGTLAGVSFIFNGFAVLQAASARR